MRWIGAKRSALLVLLSLRAAGCATSTPTPAPRGTVYTQSFDQAAAAAGMTAWGTAQDCRKMVHVTIDLDASQAWVTIGVPPDVDPKTAARWQEWATHRLLWVQPVTSPAVTSQPEAEYYQFLYREGFPPFPGLTRTIVDLHLESNGAPGPFLAAIRLAGAEASSSEPAPQARTRVGPDQFLFYSHSRFRERVSIDYGIPPRQLAALVAAALALLLFPLAALFGVRWYAGGREELAPIQRARLFHRCQRPIAVVPPLVIFLFFGASTSYLAYFGPMVGVAILALVVIPLLLHRLTARLVGLGLEWAAWPARKQLPWHRAVRSDLYATFLGTLTLAGFVLMFIPGVYPQNPRLAFLLGSICYYSPVFVILSARGWAAAVTAARRRGVLSDETDAPEDLRGAVLALTEQCAAPIRQMRMARRQNGLATGSIAVLGDRAVIGRELVEILETDQVAAVVAAAMLASPRTTAERTRAMFLAAGGTLMGAGVPACLIWYTSPFAPGVALPLALPALLLLLAPRRARERQRRADLQVAEACGDPLRYLDALRKLEELQVNTSGVNPCTPQLLPLVQRRQRLEQKLGVE